MEALVVDNIKSLVKESMNKDTIEIGGKKYSLLDYHMICTEQNPFPVEVRSLSGVSDFLKQNKDKYDLKDLTIHIVNHDVVDVFKKAEGERNQRLGIIRSKKDDTQQFPYEQFMDQEVFGIKLRAMFEDSEDLADVLAYVSKISSDNSIKTLDDGVTQSVTIKKGSSGALDGREDAPSKVNLAPFRTFPEAAQPESLFLFRMRENEGIVTCALFEADGGAWKQKARENIQSFFKENCPEVDTIS